MTHRYLSILTLFLVLGPLAHRGSAQSIPQSVPYTGSVAVNGIPFNGNGQFKFAIVNEGGNTTYWSNDGTASTGAEPVSAVTIAVSNGLYALELGNPDRANMQPILPVVFNTPLTFLRVWFSDGVNGFELLTPDRQLVSVPYAYQAQKANEVSGTGTVVKSIALAEAPATRLRDDVLFEGAGNVDVQRIGNNTIRIVGTTGTAAAVDLACATPCVSSAEISGTLTDAQIPDINTLSGTLVAAQLPNIGTLTGTVTDAQVPDVGTLSGALADAQIPSAIARDSEVTTSVSGAINAHVTAPNAHNFSSISGTLTDAQIPDINTLSGTLTAAQLPAIGTLSGVLGDAQIPGLIARDSELTWANLAGIPADIADGDDGGNLAETDPQVGAINDNRVPRWSGGTSGALVNGQIYDTGTAVGIGTPTPATELEVAGTVTVVALAARYQRMPTSGSVDPGNTTTLSSPCPAGTNVLGGGLDPESATDLIMVGSWPDAADSWSVRVRHNDLLGASVDFTIYAVCAAIR